MKHRKIYVTETDRNKLKKLFYATTGFRSGDIETVKDLMKEIDRAEIVPDEMITPDVVTMHSTVTILDLGSKKNYSYTIVFPEEADLNENKISIIAPLGTALIGYRKGDVIEWKMPAGMRRFRIKQVVPKQNFVLQI